MPHTPANRAVAEAALAIEEKDGMGPVHQCVSAMESYCSLDSNESDAHACHAVGVMSAAARLPSLRLFKTTETLQKAMAALAMIGESNQPVSGYPLSIEDGDASMRHHGEQKRD